MVTFSQFKSYYEVANKYAKYFTSMENVSGVELALKDNKLVMLVNVKEIYPDNMLLPVSEFWKGYEEFKKSPYLWKFTADPKLLAGLVKFPDQIEGVPVFVEKRIYTLLSQLTTFKIEGDPEAVKKHRPCPGGTSSVNAYMGPHTGTYGCPVWKKDTGEKLMLSNYHVYSQYITTCQEGIGNKGDPIIQPGCYSEDTRVLTKRGFIYFYEVSSDDEVLTFNLGSGELEWQKPLKIHKYRYTGPMIHFNGQMYDLLVTPNHNMVVRRYGNNKWFFATAKEILQRQFRSKIQELERARDLILKGYGRKRLSKKFGKREGEWAQKLIKKVKLGLPLMKKGITHATLELPKTGIWKCSDFKEFKIGDYCIPIDEWLQFLGFWLAEGSIYKDKKADYRILLRSYDFTKLQHMAQLLKKWGFNPSISKYGQLGFCSKQLFLWLSGNCFTQPYDSLPKGRKAYYKRVPPAFKELPSERLKVLLTWLFKGDGAFEGGKFRRYFTSSKRLAEDVAEIALKCGYAVNIREKSGFYCIGISNRNITPRITKQPVVEHYDGFVYCLTVPNHTMVVERNGKVSICGNSYDGGKDPDDRIALLYDFEPYAPYDNYIDAAVAKPLNEDDLTDNILNIGELVGERDTWFMEKVKKMGRTTGYRESWVQGYIVSANVLVKCRYVVFTDCWRTLYNFADAGDSGSLVASMDNYAVGLLFAGTMYIGEGIFCRSLNVANRFNITFKKIPRVTPPPPTTPTRRIPTWYWVAPLGGLIVGIAAGFTFGK